MNNGCKHEQKNDLSQGLGPERHYFCLSCKSHWYKGKEWTRDEWDSWVNDEPVQGALFDMEGQ